MFQPLPAFLGVRYAAARRHRGFLSFITSVAIGGLALSTAVLIVVLAVLNGFEREMRERVLAVLPQLLVFHESTFADWHSDAARLARLEGVRGVAPLVGGPVLLATVDGVRAAELSGIDPRLEPRVSIVERFVAIDAAHDTGARGALALLQPGAFRVLLGARLARRLGLAVGDSVSVVMSEAAVTPLGVFPRQKRFKVAGLVDSGTESDDQTALVHIADAQKLYRLGSNVHALRLRLDDLFKAQQVALAARLALAPAGIQTRDWTSTYGSLYEAVLMQRTIMLLLLSLLIAVAAYNVVSSLVMVVTDKQGEIAILRSLGMSRAGIQRSFLVLGLIVGCVGVLLGAVLGLAAAYSVADFVAFLQRSFGLQLLSQYFIHYLPSAPRLSDVLLVSAIGLALSLLASLYPAWQAARLLPTEILRHE